MSTPAALFPALNADEDIERLHTIESLCMNCHEDGETRLLLTHIPYFRDVIVMSFQCPHCHSHTTEIQPAGEIQEKARKLTLTVNAANSADTSKDLNRQIIKSETARILIPVLDFEIPPSSKRGEINTVEGFLTNIADSLSVDQPNRALVDKDVHDKIEALIERFRAMAAGTESFELVVDDLAGNSFIENSYAPHTDPRVKIELYARTPQQTEELGYSVQQSEEHEAQAQAVLAAKRTVGDVQGWAVTPAMNEKIDTYFNVSERSACLPGTCHSCHHDCETRMAIVDIPHFKDVILMTTECENCGFRDTEVKPAGRVSDHAVKITLTVSTIDDLKRDLLKSDTSSISIPELELDMEPGTLGGKYTTIEGILNDIKSQLQTVNPFQLGDSSVPNEKNALQKFLEQLDDCINFTDNKPFTFVLDDPLGNSFIFSEQGVLNDSAMKLEHYTRSHQQDEELGLNDVLVEPEQYLTAKEMDELQQELQREELEKQAAGITPEDEWRRRLAQEHLRLQERAAGMQHTKIGGLIKEEEETLHHSHTQQQPQQQLE